jgi:hypothetical protein
MLETHVENISNSHANYGPQIDSFMGQYDELLGI